MSVTGFNRRRRMAKSQSAPSPQPTADEQARRQELMDAIEEATGKRPGANAKTETLEARYAELNQE